MCMYIYIEIILFQPYPNVPVPVQVRERGLIRMHIYIGLTPKQYMCMYIST